MKYSEKNAVIETIFYFKSFKVALHLALKTPPNLEVKLLVIMPNT